MSDEFRRLWEQHETLRRMTDPISDLRRYIDPLENTIKRLGIESAAMDFLRQREQHREMLSDITDVSGMAKAAQEFDRYRKLLEGPVEEAKRLGLFNPHSDIQKSINAAIEAKQTYERLFRLPDASELVRIAHDGMKRDSLARTVLKTEASLQAAMATMRSPWLQIENNLASATALAEIIAMGRGIDGLRAFDYDFTAALRPGLGDWRDMLTLSPEPLIDPVLRSAFYVERGFDPDLTDFPTLAFDEGLRIAGLREPQSIRDVDGQEENFARAEEAFNQLHRFEFELRRFIERVMQVTFGDDWMKRQLPTGMFDTWTEKRDKAMKDGHAEQPLIDYADFTDYKAIIERKDNWNAVFKPIFGRAEDVRESFQRLFPVRIATMHARLITRDDELLLLVETKRVLKAIGVK